jgi:hypothetical protein
VIGKKGEANLNVSGRRRRRGSSSSVGEGDTKDQLSICMENSNTSIWIQ